MTEMRRKIAEIIVEDYPGGAGERGAMEYALSQADRILDVIAEEGMAGIVVLPHEVWERRTT
jgi:hypothetical protein